MYTRHNKMRKADPLLNLVLSAAALTDEKQIDIMLETIERLGVDPLKKVPTEQYESFDYIQKIAQFSETSALFFKKILLKYPKSYAGLQTPLFYFLNQGRSVEKIEALLNEESIDIFEPCLAASYSGCFVNTPANIMLSEIFCRSFVSSGAQNVLLKVMERALKLEGKEYLTQSIMVQLAMIVATSQFEAKKKSSYQVKASEKEKVIHPNDLKESGGNQQEQNFHSLMEKGFISFLEKNKNIQMSAEYDSAGGKNFFYNNLLNSKSGKKKISFGLGSILTLSLCSGVEDLPKASKELVLKILNTLSDDSFKGLNLKAGESRLKKIGAMADKGALQSTVKAEDINFLAANAFNVLTFLLFNNLGYTKEPDLGVKLIYKEIKKRLPVLLNEKVELLDFNKNYLVQEDSSAKSGELNCFIALGKSVVHGCQVSQEMLVAVLNQINAIDFENDRREQIKEYILKGALMEFANCAPVNKSVKSVSNYLQVNDSDEVIEASICPKVLNKRLEKIMSLTALRYDKLLEIAKKDEAMFLKHQHGAQTGFYLYSFLINKLKAESKDFESLKAMLAEPIVNMVNAQLKSKTPYFINQAEFFDNKLEFLRTKANEVKYLDMYEDFLENAKDCLKILSEKQRHECREKIKLTLSKHSDLHSLAESHKELLEKVTSIHLQDSLEIDLQTKEVKSTTKKNVKSL